MVNFVEDKAVGCQRCKGFWLTQEGDKLVCPKCGAIKDRKRSYQELETEVERLKEELKKLSAKD